MDRSVSGQGPVKNQDLLVNQSVKFSMIAPHKGRGLHRACHSPSEHRPAIIGVRPPSLSIKNKETPVTDSADMTIKERALARTTPPDSPPGRYRPPDRLLAFLEAL